MTTMNRQDLQQKLQGLSLTPLIALKHPIFQAKKIHVYLKRDDLNHPLIQGNKLHKLRLNLDEALRQHKDTLITFGGAYSNHIAATAAAGNAFGFKTIGYVRGDELALQKHRWSPTLKKAQSLGMKFIFLTRQAYRTKHSQAFLSEVNKIYPNGYLLPEGGTNDLAMAGFQFLIRDLEQQCPQWTHLYTAVGTGGSMSGMVRHCKHPDRQEIRGVSVLKQTDEILHNIQQWTKPHHNWTLLSNAHAGGYAKSNEALKKCQAWFETEFGVVLDSVYTAKMIWGFMQDLANRNLPEGSHVILYHSGGLQGRPTR